jgi:hypothetical protein
MITVNTNGATTADFKVIDLIITMETNRKISRVEGADKYGITTACMIDGEFTIVSDYYVPTEIINKLKKA